MPQVASMGMLAYLWMLLKSPDGETTSGLIAMPTHAVRSPQATLCRTGKVADLAILTGTSMYGSCNFNLQPPHLFERS